MEFVRKHAKTILTLIAFVFIAGIFYMNYAAQGPVVVRVNKTDISYDEFHSTFARRLDSIRDEKEGELKADDIARIKQSVLATMVQDELILQHAAKFGVKAPDEIVAATVMSMPAFQREGLFDEGLYTRVLAMYYKMSRYKFEEDLRISIKKQFFRDMVLSSSKVSPLELKMSFEKKFPGENFSEKKVEYRNNLLNEKRSLIYYGWMDGMIKNSTIINNLPKLESRSG